MFTVCLCVHSTHIDECIYALYTVTKYVYAHAHARVCVRARYCMWEERWFFPTKGVDISCMCGMWTMFISYNIMCVCARGVCRELFMKCVYMCVMSGSGRVGGRLAQRRFIRGCKISLDSYFWVGVDIKVRNNRSV